MLVRKIVSMKTLYAEHSTKTFLTFINKLYGDIKRRCVENWDIINNNGHTTCHSGKTGGFNSLREVIWIILWTLYYLETDWRWESVLKKALSTSFRWYVWDMSFKLADLIRRTCCKNPSEKLQQGFVIMGMRSYLLKEQLQMKFNLKKHHFVYVCEVITKCYPHFISCSYFPLALIKLNSTHCHQIYLMELFKSKERFKEKVDSNNNWKTAQPRMILEWHLFLRLSLGLVRIMLSFIWHV